MTDIQSTIIISNHNYRNYVADSIKSALRQMCPCQIIVVDDCSSDGSWGIIKKAIRNQDKDHPTFAIRLNKNSGGNARGKNIGIAYAKTKYITFLDSDDILFPNSLKTRQIKLEEKKVDFTHTKFVYLDNLSSYTQYEEAVKLCSKVSVIRKTDKNRWNADRIRISQSPMNNIEWARIITPCSVLIHREVFKNVGLFDENLKWKIDKEMWSRLINHNYTHFFHPSFSYIYRQHMGQISKNDKKKKPQEVNRKYDIVVSERAKEINNKNTIMLEEYNASNFVKATCGTLL